MTVFFWLLAFAVGVIMIVWGAEAFAEHLGRASVRLGVSSFALALLLAGAEPEELATAVAASLRGSPGIALGDVVDATSRSASWRWVLAPESRRCRSGLG